MRVELGRHGRCEGAAGGAERCGLFVHGIIVINMVYLRLDSHSFAHVFLQCAKYLGHGHACHERQ
jgi:hypothetical protein